MVVAGASKRETLAVQHAFATERLRVGTGWQRVALVDVTAGASDALRLLGLERGATRADAEHAFRERSLSCHPDKVAHLDEDFQRLAEAKFLALSEAFDLVVAAIG